MTAQLSSKLGSPFPNTTMRASDLMSNYPGDRAEQFRNGLHWLLPLLAREQVPVSSWYGTLDANPDSWVRTEAWLNMGGDAYQNIPGYPVDPKFPWFLFWEIFWVWLNLSAAVIPGRTATTPLRVLDIGGSASLFSYWMAAVGANVTTVERDHYLVDAAREGAEKLPKFQMNAVLDDIQNLDSRFPPGSFDVITAICVMEHIPVSDRVRVTDAMRKLLVPGGWMAMTFDYRNPDKRAQLRDFRQVREQLIDPSGMQVTAPFIDAGSRPLLHPWYHPTMRKRRFLEVLKGNLPISSFWSSGWYTFGSLFLRNPS